MSSERKSLRRDCGPELLRSKLPRVRGFQKLHTFATGQPPSAPPILRFGAFEVNFEDRELRKHGMRVKLEDKPFEIFEVLLRAPGKLVSRAELRAKLWPDTFVSYEHCLNTAINKLRFALGDSSRSTHFVETIRRRGYRFAGMLQAAQPAAARVARWALLVLPFRTQCLNGGPDSFMDGLTEELSAQLGRIDPASLGIVAVTTAMLYKGADCSVAEIGRKAGADLVIEGSVRRWRERVRVSAQLVRASEQLCLWSEIYNGTLTDPFGCQAEIAQSVASAVASELNLRAPRTQLPKFGAPISLSSERVRKLGS